MHAADRSRLRERLSDGCLQVWSRAGGLDTGVPDADGVVGSLGVVAPLPHAGASAVLPALHAQLSSTTGGHRLALLAELAELAQSSTMISSWFSSVSTCSGDLSSIALTP